MARHRNTVSPWNAGPQLGGAQPSIGQVVERLLRSRGLTSSAPLNTDRHPWVRATVRDIRTGEAKGHRWLKRDAAGRWTVLPPGQEPPA